MTKDEIIRNYGSLSLAYIGDAVYELLVRKHILEKGITVNGQMHLAAKRYVSAAAQSQLLSVISEHLTEDELGVIRRGRNAKGGNVPKSASVEEYRTATGFESLLGKLYLEGKNERISYLVGKAIESLEV